MYFFVNLKSVFKKHAFNNGNKSIILPSIYDIPDNEGDIQDHAYKFNRAIGYPPGLEKASDKLAAELAGKPLTFAKHAKDQALAKNLDFDTDLAHLNNRFPLPEHGFNYVETEVVPTPKGRSRISKLVMRGPRQGKSDAVMPVIIDRNTIPNTLVVPTVWPNDKDDPHATLDLRRIHLPEEFAHGTWPTRRLATPQEARASGYQPLYYTPEIRNEIAKKHRRY